MKLKKLVSITFLGFLTAGCAMGGMVPTSVNKATGLQSVAPMYAPIAAASSVPAAPMAGSPLDADLAGNISPSLEEINKLKDNFFQNYGVNPFVETTTDHFSTFALDVDTASYTLMRKFINEGYLPDKDSVRIEEYINFFENDKINPGCYIKFSLLKNI